MQRFGVEFMERKPRHNDIRNAFADVCHQISRHTTSIQEADNHNVILCVDFMNESYEIDVTCNITSNSVTGKVIQPVSRQEFGFEHPLEILGAVTDCIMSM